MQWGDRYAVGMDGPPVRLIHMGRGHDANPALTCEQCGESVTTRDIRAVDARRHIVDNQAP